MGKKRKAPARKTAASRGPVDWSKELHEAQREFARNKSQVETGETYRGHKPVDPKGSPSSTDRGRRF